jgi:hypothetical protein
MTEVTYSIFFPIVPGISNKCDGCDPRQFIGYCFDEENQDHEFTIKFTTFKTYEGIMITSPSRDFIWSCQDLTDHGHMMITEDIKQEFIDDGDWDEEHEFYYQYRIILEQINYRLN